MADIRWIKLRIDMFDDEKIKIIQSMPDGDSILVIWIRLIALAGKCNANGLVLVEDEFPYSDEMLSVIFNKPLPTVRLALSTFEKFNMIENTEKGFYITNFDRHQNIDGMEKIREQNRIRKQRERERKRALGLGLKEESVPELPCYEDGESHADNVTSHVTSQEMSREVTTQNKNKEIDIYNISSNEDIVENGEAASTESRLDYQKIMDDFHRTCVDLPRIRALSDARRKKIKSLLKEFEKLKLWPGETDYEKLHHVFEMANASDFLSGRNGKWNGCSFEWLLNKTNALKVIEGQYSNKGGGSSVRNDRTNDSKDQGGSTTENALERFRRNAGV